jgi:uncharacterized membrane protein
MKGFADHHRFVCFAVVAVVSFTHFWMEVRAFQQSTIPLSHVGRTIPVDRIRRNIGRSDNHQKLRLVVNTLALQRSSSDSSSPSNDELPTVPASSSSSSLLFQSSSCLFQQCPTSHTSSLRLPSIFMKGLGILSQQQQHQEQRRGIMNSNNPMNSQTGFRRRLELSWLSVCTRKRRWLTTLMMSSQRWIRRTATAVAICCLIHFTVLPPPPPAWAAPGSGRMGGSFGSSGGRNQYSSGRVYRSPSTSRSSLRSFSSSPYSSSSSSSGRIRNYRPYGPPVHVFFHRPPPQLQLQLSSPAVESTAVTTADSATSTITTRTNFPGHHQHQQHGLAESTSLASGIVWGAFFGTVTALGIRDQLRNGGNGDKNNKDMDSPLGPGASVLSLTACLSIPNRDDPTNILHRLQTLADSSDTGSRKGLQRLLADTSLELLRQERSIVSVESQCEHFPHSQQHHHTMTTPSSSPSSVIEAERSFRTMSTKLRSKFDRESRSNYNGERRHPPRLGEGDYTNPTKGNDITATTTMAIVGINLAIDGNSMNGLFKKNIKTRKDLIDALTQLSSDVQVDDCLLSAEVIWSPDDPADQLQVQDVYADFPTLNILLD